MGHCCFRGSTDRVGSVVSPSTSEFPAVRRKDGHKSLYDASLPVDDVRQRARKRAIQSLAESLENEETIVPNTKWRRQYFKTPGIGAAVIALLVEHIKTGSFNEKVPSSPHGKSDSSSIQSKHGKLHINPPNAALPSGRRHHIHLLDLRSLRIGNEGFVKLLTALLHDDIVEHVLLGGNEIGDPAVNSLINNVVQGLSDSPSTFVPGLKQLSLSDNPITGKGVAAFTLVASRFSMLERLEVGYGESNHSVESPKDVHDIIGADDTRIIAEYIEATSKLKTFLFRGSGACYPHCTFSPENFAVLVESAIGKSSLKQLILEACYSSKTGNSDFSTPAAVNNNGSKENGCSGTAPNLAYDVVNSTESSVQRSFANMQLPIHKAVAALGAATSTLETLVFRFPLGDESVQLLAAGLAKASHLQNLSLRGCDLTAKALSMIGDALTTNRVLRVLDVSYQSIAIAHPAVLTELRSSSKRNQPYSFTLPDLCRIEPSSAGHLQRDDRQHPAMPLIKSLHKNRTLVELGILGINISTEDIEELCACIERSGNRTIAQVSYTSSGNDALNMKLEEFLSSNRNYSVNGPWYSSTTSGRGMGGRFDGSTSTLFGDQFDPRYADPHGDGDHSSLANSVARLSITSSSSSPPLPSQWRPSEAAPGKRGLSKVNRPMEQQSSAVNNGESGKSPVAPEQVEVEVKAENTPYDPPSSDDHRVEVNAAPNASEIIQSSSDFSKLRRATTDRSDESTVTLQYYSQLAPGRNAGN